MGILITGMEIPKKGSITIRIYADGTVYEPTTSVFVLNKVATAIPVPPHGRLINADAIRKDWLENYRYALTRSILDSLDNADTIIPAEGETK